MAQRLARDERHNIEEEVVLRAGGEDWEDVRVLQVGSDSDFLPEARSTDLAREFGREQFYDDLPVERRLSREEETTHAAAAELALDVVGVAEDTLQASLEIGHAVTQVVRQLHHRGHGQTRPEGRASVSHFRPV